ncbi:MAG TPA: hypothetical protein VEX38_10780, partial [Fimbriimonadaceae bacterium]|nr:hypothetical protein [Fimbriimonadaceae bacterium]
IHFKMKHLEEDLYLYRMHEGSLTATRENEILQKTAFLIEEYLAKVPYAKGKVKFESHLALVHYCRRSKMFGKMFKHLSLALLSQPLTTITHVGPRALKRMVGITKSA